MFDKADSFEKGAALFLQNASRRVAFAAALMSATALNSSPIADAQITFTKADDKLDLPADSPFRDPDIIYLEADELINDAEAETLTAEGEVEGRYQDKTLRAEKVIYNFKTGKVFAVGSVVLINADGSAQYADKIELSDELETGTATSFASRFPNGGQIASAFAARNTENGIELYNAYYTACEACTEEDGTVKKPTWRLKARRVIQDKESKSVRYRDAVFEFKGLPLFYTPYLAHPDPSAGRASGFMIPFVGLSGNKGLVAHVPYYFAIDPYTELTVVPRLHAKVNPMLEARFRRKFFSGEISLDGSVTKSHFFDNNGDDFADTVVFEDPLQSVQSDKWRSHFFARGQFDINEQWHWGFQAGYATDDNYLDRYDLDEEQGGGDFGLYQPEYRRLMQQVFLVGQGDNYRATASAMGNVSLRTSIVGFPIFDMNGDLTGSDPDRLLVSREDDSSLPILAPKIEYTNIQDNLPFIGGRLKLHADATVLNRKHVRDANNISLPKEYRRVSSSADWKRTTILPGGLEVKPFAQGNADVFRLRADGQDQFRFRRFTGQTGVDVRWPFVRPGKSVDLFFEPRAQITQSFGDGKLINFSALNGNGTPVTLNQDGLDIDFDQSLLWSPNKSTGYDLWQKGRRIDVGGTIGANWGTKSSARLFAGQSYYSGNDQNVYALESGLQGDKSDIVGQLDLKLGSYIRSNTRVRYDEDNSIFRRLDTSLALTSDRLSGYVRYFTVNSPGSQIPIVPTPTIPNPVQPTPTEEISGHVQARLIDNWSVRYDIYRDLGIQFPDGSSGITRRQAASLIYDDNCTRIEFIYEKKNNELGIIGESDSFGIRVSLLTLGAFDDN